MLTLKINKLIQWGKTANTRVSVMVTRPFFTLPKQPIELEYRRDRLANRRQSQLREYWSKVGRKYLLAQKQLQHIREHFALHGLCVSGQSGPVRKSWQTLNSAVWCSFSHCQLWTNSKAVAISNDWLIGKHRKQCTINVNYPFIHRWYANGNRQYNQNTNNKILYIRKIGYN